MNSPTMKTALFFSRRLVFISVALFVPAGSLDFWQAWVFLAIFFIGELLILVHLVRNDPVLLKRRRQRGWFAEKRIFQQVIMSLVRLFYMAMLLVAGFDHRFDWSHVPAWLAMGADVALLLGWLLVLAVFKENSFASAIIEIAVEQKVISTGPYAVVRHPMYSGTFLMNIFMPIALGSWWGTPFAVGLLMMGILRILDEERLLRQSLPGYEEYCRKVRYRLIPRIW